MASGPAPAEPAGDGGWPAVVAAVAAGALTAEFATLTRAGAPVTVPTTPYVAATGDTLDVSTGLTYPAKAERARRDPRVALLLADPVGAATPDPPVVLVQGLATVHDADLQANTDRYVAASAAKLPDATRGQPKVALRRMPWYFARVWVAVTPLRVRWWPDRDLGAEALEWRAPAGTAAAPSDPAPTGPAPAPWRPPPADWRPLLDDALARLGPGDLTTVDDDGFPLPLPLRSARREGDLLVGTLGPGAPALRPGSPACATFHRHPERFTGQENRTVVGTLDAVDDDGTVRVRVARALADWSLAGNRAVMALGFVRSGLVLRRRLASEAARRGQRVPVVHLP